MAFRRLPTPSPETCQGLDGTFRSMGGPLHIPHPDGDRFILAREAALSAHLDPMGRPRHRGKER